MTGRFIRDLDHFAHPKDDLGQTNSAPLLVRNSGPDR